MNVVFQGEYSECCNVHTLQGEYVYMFILKQKQKGILLWKEGRKISGLNKL